MKCLFHRLPRTTLAILLIAALAACTSAQEWQMSDTDTDWTVLAAGQGHELPEGDPEAGYRYAANGDYIGSGVPWRVFGRWIKGDSSILPGREGRNADLPYALTAFAAPNGEWVYNGNCFSCHGGKLMGEVVPGLGDSRSDFTRNSKAAAGALDFLVKLKYGKDQPEREAYQPFGQMFKAIQPYVKTQKVGVNAAARLESACVRYRRPGDMKPIDTPRWTMNKRTPASDVPPLWNVAKKKTLYYNGMGHGSFAKLVLQACVLGTPDSSHANKQVKPFQDVVAWCASIEPPVYPRSVDRPLAARGEKLFQQNCASCHGTYGKDETYPNKIVALDAVGTDPLYAMYFADSASDGHRLVQWGNKSWFAQTEPASYAVPFKGYVAPPLDGIWASAPYLHNGSVPTLYHLLHPEARPRYWKRASSSEDYDFERVGWQYRARKRGGGRKTYDTTLPGYGHEGHTYGAKLPEADKQAIIEYMKTL
jgi:mono/diheme cytochrome c family protein